MKFTEFVKEMQKHFTEMTKDAKVLFTVNVDPEKFYNLYLDSFPDGTNNIYRKRREYDCSCCRHFIRDLGNVVTIKNGKVDTIWNLNINDGTYSVVAKVMDLYIKKCFINGVYVRDEAVIGTKKSREMLPTGEVNTYDHFFMNIPKKFIYTGYETKDTVKGNYNAIKHVFKRSLDEISIEATETVLELIAQNSLYKGAEWKKPLTEFKRYQKEYSEMNEGREKDLYAWEKSIEAGAVIGKIRNHSIGTLLVNISEGMELDTAVKKYKRPKAIFTKKMLEDAKKTITELGYMGALQRRFATLDDITVNNILFSNKDSAKRISGAMDLFDEMESEVAIDPKKFTRVEEISVEDFIKNVLPIAKELEVYLENKHVQNMVSLIAPENKEEKTMFKWDNGFSWAYTGNITDSDIKENVKAAGGSVTGIVRFSIQWNDGDGKDNSDLEEKQERLTALKQRIDELTSMDSESAQNGDFDELFESLFTEMYAIQDELEDAKKTNAKLDTAVNRIDEMTTVMYGLKNHPVEYDEQIVRQLISSIKVISAEQILILFKDGTEMTADL